jgi:DNA repair exonuclease SbcCD ATPase subunit
MASPEQQNDQVVFAYKLSQVDQDVERLREQLRLYVTARENELQLRSIQDSVSRIERDMSETKKQIGEVDTKLAAQQQALDQLQIKVLWGLVSVILSVLTAIFIGYVTHFFH